MLLLDPRHHARSYPDPRSKELMLATIGFFEAKGKRRLKQDDRERTYYQDFLDFQKQEQLFATMLTPSRLGSGSCRWDTWRICDVNEILAFYGLHYWYTWQVSILGLGPIWMSRNQAAKEKAAALLRAGGVFAYGLSEKEHGADVYSTGMRLTPRDGGGFRADGSKYYIGNAQKAAMVSVFGKLGDEFVFFAADPAHPRYECKRNLVNAQSYVGEFSLGEYPVDPADLLHQGSEAWDACLNTVNIGKYNLGWASIGIGTHALYESVQHAHHRHLYGHAVTEFPHVRQALVDAYTRLVAMKLVALRAADYMRAASADDRRYLLFNPLVKMRVTTQGERVIDGLWDVVAAKGFERETYFEMAARDIRALPKLEGTVHVNVALILKFLPAYFFDPAPFPPVPTMDAPGDDLFLFDQGPARGLGKIRFHDFGPVLASASVPNLAVFREQVAVFRDMLKTAGPDGEAAKDTGFLLAWGEIFAAVVYGQLVLENAPRYAIEPALLDGIFDVLVREISELAVALHGRAPSTAAQQKACLGMVRKPVVDPERARRIWEGHVLPLADGYRMRD